MRTQPGNIKNLLSQLRKTYPHPKVALVHSNPYELLAATILSAQCTDQQVNKVTPALFARFPTAAALAEAGLPEVETLIHATGFFHNKAKNLLGMARELTERFQGRVPDSMEQLITLPGVARKTANVVLGTVFGKTEGIVVDTHVRRVSRRLGLTREDAPVKIERDLMACLPRKEWHRFSLRLIEHGRNICRARKPTCPVCPLSALCPSAGMAQATIDR